MFNRFFSQIINRRDASHGGILVEFALAIPLLILVLFYAFDVPKYKTIQDKISFCAHCAVNMFQNVSTNRVDKKLTRADIGKCFSAAMLVAYPATAQYSLGGDTYRNGHFPLTFLFYVKGLPEGNASVIWMWDSGKQGTSPYVGVAGSPWDKLFVKARVNVPPTEIYKGLEINEGEVKIIAMVTCYAEINTFYPDGRRVGEFDSPKELFNFHIMPVMQIRSLGSGAYFTTVIVFTPKPGLFTETPPT